jgi:hypothetical protein
MCLSSCVNNPLPNEHIEKQHDTQFSDGYITGIGSFIGVFLIAALIGKA